MTISQITLEEARERYESERWRHIAATPEARKKLDEDAAHDVAVDLGLDPEELALAFAEEKR